MPLSRIFAGVLVLALLPALATARAASGRIKRKLLSVDEQQRVLSETVMNDGSLQVGDIVVTDRGYFVFEGIGEDGSTNKFRAIAAPSAQSVSPAVKSKQHTR